MLERPQLRDARRVAEIHAPWCVTVYGTAEDWLHGNQITAGAAAQIRSVRQRLTEAGAPAAVVAAMQARLQAVAEPDAYAGGAVDSSAQAVAVFASESGVETFALTTSPTPRVSVADRFLVGPLVAAALDLIPPVFVLALSEREVRLLDVTAHPVAVVPVPGLPRDLESTVALDLTGDRQTLAHLRTSEDPKTRLAEYSRAIDRTVEPVVRGHGGLLIIAAAEPLASIYRATTDYPLVAAGTIVGNHDGVPAHELAALAVPLTEAHRTVEVERQLARFAELPARALVATELSTILDAARAGAIDTLFVDVDRQVAASSDASAGASAADLVDEVVRDALDSDARIVPVRATDLPTQDPVAAVLRFPISGIV